MKKIFFFVLILLSINAYSSQKSFLITKTNKIYISTNGQSWQDITKNLPSNINPERVYSTQTDDYLLTEKSGIFKLINNNSWKNISSNDFKTRSIYNIKSYRKISAFTHDLKKPQNLAIATKHSIYRSYNSGKSWKKIKTRGISNRNYITSLAIDGKKIVVGTSFNGVYLKRRGKYRSSNKGLPQEPYSGRLFFTEQIDQLYFDKNKNLYAGTAFGKGVYERKFKSNRWKKIKFNRINKYFKINSIKRNNKYIIITADDKIYSTNKKVINKLSTYQQKTINESKNFNVKTLSINNSFMDFRKAAKVNNNPGANKKTLYTSIYRVNRSSKKLIGVIKRANYNAVVIDMKDDFGKVLYNTKNKTAKEIGARRSSVNLKKLLQEFKKNKIYTIARIVVFKDKQLYKAYNYKYAIRNSRTGKNWKGSPREFWVDPHSKFVQNYNIDIGAELQKFGFDEIQFDYIRFPSDGATYLCKFPYKKNKDTYKSEILSDFLTKAKSKISVPISVDIYGFNSWYHFGNHIGQDIEAFSKIVDVICPMVYPSHFGNRFYMKGKRSLRPYRIVYDGGVRSIELTRNRAVIRPYIQAFKMMNSSIWGPDYINNQIKAVEDSNCSGFTFWNARGDYKMVEKAAKEYKAK